MLKKIYSLVILLIVILNLLCPILSIATDEIVIIKFEDENLYNAIIEKIDDKIEGKNDNTYEISIKESNLETITYLNIKSKNIMNIKGLSSFKNITSLNLNDNKIEDISELSKMKNIVTLDITQNKIKDISSLSYLTNIKKLYIGYNGFSIGGNTYNGGILDSSNKISDLQPLSPLTNIEVLEIAGIGVRDISVLENLTNLKVLDATSNDIDDITVLSKLKNLYCLILHGNGNIKDFQAISDLTGLTRLSLGKTGISNISFLRNLTNLTTLNLSYNDIIDITPLSNMSNLTMLSIGNNSNLKDISPLAQCSKLQALYVPYDNINNIDSLNSLEDLSISICGNKIDNLNIIDEGRIKLSDAYFFMLQLDTSSCGWSIKEHPQFLQIETDKKEIELPPIFIQAKNENSKIYTDQEFELLNCTLNESKDRVILDDNIEEATVLIRGGKISESKLTIKYEDNISPDLEVTYSNEKKTNKTVTATIKSNEKIQQVEGWTLSEDETKLYKVYAKNAVETVKVYDLAGNESKANISINNIDTELPQAEIKYSTTKPTNKNVMVTIITDKEIQEVEGWKLSDDKTTLTKEFKNNKEENITIYDLAGNDRKITIKVNNIDKAPPKTKIHYSNTGLTNKNVTVTITADEEMQKVKGWVISSDRKKIVKEYKSNVNKEKVIIKDLAGNSVENEITITNIDKRYSTIQKNDKDNIGDETVAKNTLPQTGKNAKKIIMIIIGNICIILLIMYKKYKNKTI